MSQTIKFTYEQTVELKIPRIPSKIEYGDFGCHLSIDKIDEATLRLIGDLWVKELIKKI